SRRGPGTGSRLGLLPSAAENVASGAGRGGSIGVKLAIGPSRGGPAAATAAAGASRAATSAARDSSERIGQDIGRDPSTVEQKRRRDGGVGRRRGQPDVGDRKSTRLNSSH